MAILCYTPIWRLARAGRPLLAAWLAAMFPALPLVMLHATWLAAWFLMGRPPRPGDRFPESNSPLLWYPYSAFGPSCFVWLLCPFSAIVIWHAGERTTDSSRREEYLVPIYWIAWPLVCAATLGLLWLDPLGAASWFMDD